jgi:hypothetical protein
MTDWNQLGDEVYKVYVLYCAKEYIYIYKREKKPQRELGMERKSELAGTVCAYYYYYTNVAQKDGGSNAQINSADNLTSRVCPVAAASKTTLKATKI